MFYCHKAALMYDSRAAIRAFTIAEIPFIFLSATVFVMLFYWIMVSDTSQRVQQVYLWTRTSNICFGCVVGCYRTQGFRYVALTRTGRLYYATVNHLFARRRLKRTMPKLMHSFSFSLFLINRAEAVPFLYFYMFITVTLAAFTFLGQMLVTLCKDTITAQGFGSLIIVSSSFFGGAFGQ